MGEELIVGLIEKSLIGGAFIYMLHYFLGQFSSALESVSDTLQDVSSALSHMNHRLDSIEERINKVERRDSFGQTKCN